MLVHLTDFTDFQNSKTFKKLVNMIFFQRIMKTLLFAQLMILLIAHYGNTTFIKCHYLPHNCSEINIFNLPISVSKLTL